MSIDAVIHAINNLDLKQISLENVEILQKMTPTEQEVKAYREYTNERKDPILLTDEDKFMMQLAKVERISSKLAIMNYMGNFFDSLHLISPVRILMYILTTTWFYWNLNDYFIMFPFTASSSDYERIKCG